MSGKWRWTFGFGVFGAALVFLFQVSRNTLGTTLLRSLYAFIVFALLALAIRIALAVLLKPAAVPSLKPSEQESGSQIDLSTPDDGAELTGMMKEQWTSDAEQKITGFQPLNPARLVSLDRPATEDVVQAVRRMTDE